MTDQAPEAAASARIPKGERTRELILTTSIGLFQERGFEATTMRLIAERAGVALGNSYHYFPTKDHLVQAMYRRIHGELATAAADVLEHETSLHARLLGVMRCAIDVIEPYHAVAGALFRVAADPDSPLNPFSEDSKEVRDIAIGLMEQVVTGSRDKLPDDLTAELPRLLWLFHMGVILLWVHDRSPGRMRTRRATDESVKLIIALLNMAGLPLMRRQRRRLLSLIAAIADPLPAVAAGPE